MKRAPLIALSFLAAATATALAQTQRPQAPAAPQQRSQPSPAPPAPTAPEPPPTAYEPDMLKLAEVMGSIAFLRELCGEDGSGLRTRMSELIEAEGVTQGRRERLAGAYNRGYRGFALTYRSCTDAAGEAKARLVADGERLIRALSGRFGG